jgi:nucleosome binding factor SPN SPT16 subunit
MPQLRHSEWLIAFTRKCIFILSNSGKWTNAIKSACDRLPPDFNQKIELLVRDKGDKNKTNFATIVQAVKQEGGSRLGCVLRDKTYGNFATMWESAVKQSGLELVDVTDGMWEILNNDGNVSKVGKFSHDQFSFTADKFACICTPRRLWS